MSRACNSYLDFKDLGAFSLRKTDKSRFQRFLRGFGFREVGVWGTNMSNCAKHIESFWSCRGNGIWKVAAENELMQPAYVGTREHTWRMCRFPPFPGRDKPSLDAICAGYIRT